jgi:hypothetical protein
MDVSLVKQLEDLLYGTPTVPGRLPLPSELFDLMNFGTTITVTELVDETMNAGAAGIINTPMFSVAAARQYLTVHVDHDLQWWFEVQNINATDNGDGTYDMSDGGDTVVIVP